MFSRIGAKSSGGTLRPVKKHGNEKRATLSNHTKRTLGSGNLRAAVALPKNEDKNEWIAANTVDFFNEISLLYGLVADDAAKFTQPGDGFPPGFEYRWQAPGTDSKPIKCSSPEYVDYVMTWVEDQINNESIFPIRETDPFPANFETYVKDIFKRLFRIFAIIYNRHFAIIESLEAAAHLNTCFKHFAFFCFEFDMVDEKEAKALKGPMDRMREEYDEAGEVR
jgi:MOB kinase activator 1